MRMKWLLIKMWLCNVDVFFGNLWIKVHYPVQDATWPGRRWNKKHTIAIDLSGYHHEATCDGCGKKVSKLKPFGGAGDPLVGDFTGQRLVKIYRSMAPHEDIDENPVEIEWLKLRKIHKSEDTVIRPLLIEKFGKKAVDDWDIISQMTSSVGSSRECRDCILLDEKEFHDLQLKTIKGGGK